MHSSLYGLINQKEVIGSIALLLFVFFLHKTSCFNLNKDNAEDKSNFFGVPTPAGCGLLILPLVQSFLGFDWAKENEIFLCIYILIIGLLLISNLPTFSLKQFKINKQKKLYIFLIVLFLIYLSLINFLWIAINVIGIMYLLNSYFSLDI